MLEEDKGFYVVRGYNTFGRHYAVDVKPEYVGFATFTEAPGLEPDLEWAELKEYLETPTDRFHASGMPDQTYTGRILKDFPTAKGKTVRYGGRIYFHLDGMIGRDELSDYSIIDLATAPSGDVLPWRNRFARSSREKVDTSFRHRARNPQQIGVVVFWPLRVDDLTQTRIEIVTGPEGAVMLNDTTPTGEIDGPAVIPEDGRWYEQFYFHAEADPKLTVPAGELIEIPIQLRWRKPEAPACEAEVTLKVEEVAGFAPLKRVHTNAKGQGFVRASAHGLRAGEQLVLKLNTDHFSGVGKLVVEVV